MNKIQNRCTPISRDVSVFDMKDALGYIKTDMNITVLSKMLTVT